MGTLYYDTSKYSNKRWRVQIRHRHFKSISRSFDKKDHAKEFLKKADKLIQEKITRRKDNEAFEILKKNI